MLCFTFNNFVLGSNHQSFDVSVQHSWRVEFKFLWWKKFTNRIFPEQERKYTTPIMKNTKIITKPKPKYTTDLTSNPVGVEKRFVEVSYRFLSFMFRAEPNESKLPALPIP